MDWVFLFSRICIAIVFALLALRFHFGGIGMTYAESYRVPLRGILMPLSGVLMVVAAGMVAAGAWADLGALVLAAVLLVMTGFMHAFWKEDDPQAGLGQQVHFAKNLGLVAAALVLFFVYSELDEPPLSATQPFFE
jgi:putative oxidoreductase